MNSNISKILKIVRERGILQAKELGEFDLTRKHLASALKAAQLIRLGRGIYAEVDAPINSRLLLAQVCKQIPTGVICLTSALQFHRLGTQSPSEIWIAIPAHSHRPSIEYPPIQLVEFSKQAYRLGIEYSQYKQTEIRVYSAAKTIVDCFRFRNKIGLDIALEALKDYLSKPGNTSDELMEYALQCRISTVIRPYLEALH